MNIDTILFAGFLFDILHVVMPVSLAFQKSNATPHSNFEAIQSCFEALNKMLVVGFPTPSQMKSVMVDSRDGFVMFKNMQLAVSEKRGRGTNAKTLEGVFSAQHAEGVSFVGAIIGQINNRFKSQFSPVLKATSVLHTSLMPLQDTEALLTYGDQEVAAVTSHFEHILVSKGCVTYSVMHEWQSVKAFVQNFKAKNENNDVEDAHIWAMVLAKVEFSNIGSVLKIMMVMPTSTADCERSFSLMKRFKTELRSALKTRFISHLMTVKLNTPDYDQLDDAALDPYVKSWWSKKVRRISGGTKRKRVVAKKMKAP
jgi:hypothetical protein